MQRIEVTQMSDSEIVSFCKKSLAEFHWDDMTQFERVLAANLGIADTIDGYTEKKIQRLARHYPIQEYD